MKSRCPLGTRSEPSPTINWQIRRPESTGKQLTGTHRRVLTKIRVQRHHLQERAQNKYDTRTFIRILIRPSQSPFDIANIRQDWASILQDPIRSYWRICMTPKLKTENTMLSTRQDLLGFTTAGPEINIRSSWRTNTQPSRQKKKT